MRTTERVSFFFYLSLALLGCSMPQPGDGGGVIDATGVAMLGLTLAPTDARCLVITVAPPAGRPVTRTISLAPQQSTVVSLSGLPTGSVTFSGQAFTQPCTDIARQSPTWISDPVMVTLTAGSPVTVALAFRRVDAGGQATVATDFPPDAQMFHLFRAGNGLESIAPGPDGALWFTSFLAGQTGRLTTAGDITTFQLAAGLRPRGITPGPDGALWFTERADADSSIRIGRMTTDGALTEFPTPDFEPVAPISIVTGPDGNLWFAETFSGKIGRITLSGTVTELAPPSGGITPQAIAAGSDGNMWFTNVNQIVRLTMTGVFTTFAIPTDNPGAWDITSGPDGNLWFTEAVADQIGRIDPRTGTITEFRIPTTGVGARAITAGPDGNLWFTEFAAHRVGRVTPAGTITELASPPGRTDTPGAQTITGGSDGNLWYVQFNELDIVQIDL